VTKVTTTEYIRGEAQQVVAKFRAYASPSEAFKDYAKLLKESPRYSGVMETVTAAATPSPQRFAQGLQRAGYATDPAYADKLTRIINTTLRLQRVVT
jgi:flagellar protein FlgJ